MNDQFFTMSTFAAKCLSHTPDNTTTFLRGDNTFTNTLTGSFIIEQPNGSSQDVWVKRGQHGIWLGIGANNQISGLYSTTLNRWIVSVDPSINPATISDTSQAHFYGNADTANSLYSTPNNKLQFLRADNTWTDTLEGPYRSTGTNILFFEYLGYDETTHVFTGRAHHRGVFSVDDNGVTLALPNGRGDNKVLLTLYIRNNYDSGFAPVKALSLDTHSTSEFTGAITSTATEYNTVSSGLVLREVQRNGSGNLSVNYAPRLGFNWNGQNSGSLYMDTTGKFYLVQSDGTTMGAISALADQAIKAQYDWDAINDIRYQYVKVFNSDKLRQSVNNSAGFNTTLTVNDLAGAGNAFATIQAAANNPAGTATTVNCISISRHMASGSKYTSQIVINPSLQTFYFRGAGNSNITTVTSWRQVPTFTQNTTVGSATLPVFVDTNGVLGTITSYEGNAASATQLQTTRKIWGQNFNGTANVNGTLTINNDDIIIQDSGTSTRQIRWQVGASDYARIAAGATASDAGWIEIATADNGNEPIYVRQYSNTFGTITRTLTLLNASGNSIFPGTITAKATPDAPSTYYGFIGNLDGRAKRAERLADTSDSGITAGSLTQPIYFTTDGLPASTTYYLQANVAANGNANRLAYYSAVDNSTLSVKNTISAGTIVTNGTYMSNISYLTINGDNQTDYRLRVYGNIYNDGTIWCGTQTTNTAGSGERQIGVANGAGKLYMYATASTTGNKGLYGCKADGTSKAYLTIKYDNSVTLHGNAETASKLTTEAVGSNVRPIYFTNGIPVICNETLAVNISLNAATATWAVEAGKVTWGNVTGKPSTDTDGKINWSGLNVTGQYAGSPYLNNGPATYVCLEKQGDYYELNFDTGTSASAVRAIYFNAHWRHSAGGRESGATTAETITYDSSKQVKYYFCSYRNVPTSGNESRYQDAWVYAGRVYNAYWNDYAEFRRTLDGVKPGQVVIDHDDGSMEITTKRLLPGAQIVSDTYGTSMGESEKDKTPVAVAGRVLACPYRNKKEYHAGMAVCSAPNGTVDIMSKLEIVLHPDCIIGYVSEIPDYDMWGQVQVNGRIWIKLR